MRSLTKLMFWFFIWLPLWAFTVLFKQKEAHNCMTWALKQWEEKGGYLVIRWCRSSSHSFKWPHFLWLPEDKHQDLIHVIPVDASTIEKKFIPDLWFEPKVLHGDKEENC